MLDNANKSTPCGHQNQIRLEDAASYIARNSGDEGSSRRTTFRETRRRNAGNRKAKLLQVLEEALELLEKGEEL